MSLESYLSNGWIRRHQSSPDEIARLWAIADRDISQCQTPGLGPEWRFDIAYNAALQSAISALAAAGYRADRQNQHMRTFECLAFTVGLAQSHVDFLDACRRKRHASVYDHIGAISDQEADEMTAMARQLRSQVEAWVKANHTDLIA